MSDQTTTATHAALAAWITEGSTLLSDLITRVEALEADQKREDKRDDARAREDLFEGDK